MAWRSTPTGRPGWRVVTIGYGDGLPRELSQRGGEVLIRGRRCPMVGRMCMDQLLVDVTELDAVSPGDVVTLIGRDGGRRSGPRRRRSGAEPSPMSCSPVGKPDFN